MPSGLFEDAVASLEPSGDMLEHLVSEAVKKVLLQKEMLPGPATETPARDLVSQVVEELELKAAPNEETKQPASIPSYNPTPIVELNKKRHIPVPYTPSISSKVQLKRRASPESSSEYRSPNKRSKLALVPTPPVVPLPLPSLEYNPDVDTSKCVGYSPSSANNQGGTVHSYTPSAIATLVPPVTDYVPVGSGSVKATYEPSGVKSKEPEYMPLSDNVSSSINSYIPTDKSKLLEFSFDDMLPEFEMLDEILQEHAQTTAEEDALTNSENEGENDVSDGATTNGIANGTADVPHGNGAIESESNLVNGDIVPISPKSDKCIQTNGRSDASLPAETSKKQSLNDVGDRGSKENIATDIKSKSSKSNKDGDKSKSSRRSSSHKDVSSSKSSSKTETKDTKHSNKHKSKHKDKHKDDHNNKLSIHKTNSSHSTTKDSKKRSSSSRSKTSSSKRSSRHKSSSSDHKQKSTTKSRGKSSPSKIPVEDPDSKQESSDDWETNSVMSHTECALAFAMESDLDDDEIEQQCLRIFQEYKPSPKVEKTKLPSCQEVIDISDDSHSRKRTAHEGAHRMSHLAPPAKRLPVNPDRMVAERYQAAKILYEKNKEEETLQKNERLQKMISTDSSKMAMRLQKMRELAERNSDTKPLTSGKVRIAHVPNVDGLLKAKIKVQSFTVRRKQLEELKQRKADAIKRHEEHVQSTVAQTVPKGNKRMAHLPAARILEEPVILPEPGMKVPATLRQKSLNLLVKEHLIFFDKEESYIQAEEQEKLIYGKASNSISYTSSISSAVLRLRKELGPGSNVDPSNSTKMASTSRRTVSHSVVIAGRSRGSWSIETPVRVAYSHKLFFKLEKYLLTEEQLIMNGFPRKHPTITGAAVANTKYNKNEAVVPFERDCIRCQKKYKVNEHGLQTVKDICVFHESKPFTPFNRGRYDTARRYMCCNAGLDSSMGCQESDFHVCTNFQLTNHGFQPTQPPATEPKDGDYGVFALDCEMCYTTLGLELVRVTIINEQSNIVLDEFVCPEGKIIDYATKFSGVTAEDMEGVTSTLRDVQARIFTFVNNQTILIGHSLDSDLRVLKILHDRVVDTSVVYPHNDPTKKKALRTLANFHLKKAIQQGIGGHDSAEDAKAALDLMIYKINSEYH